MKRGMLVGVMLLLAAALLMTGCAKTPVTERSQFILLSVEDEVGMGAREADKIVENAKISRDALLNARVRGIGKKIAAVSGREDFEWEFTVIEDEAVNAFCLPGGKVFFYTGILKLMENDDQIAAVMGHEIAHALARHGAERVSMQMASNLGAQVLAAALDIPAEYQDVYAQAYGATSQVGLILPYSRKFEHEADQIGVFLMNEAGYDPVEAVRFWEKMQAMGGNKPPVFLSTHPSDVSRIEAIRAYIETLPAK